MPAAAQTLPAVEALVPSLLSPVNSGLKIFRDDVKTPFFGESVNNLNLGMGFSPVKGFDLRADAWRIEVEDFPAFILVDDKGNDFFLNLPAGCGVCAT